MAKNTAKPNKSLQIPKIILIAAKLLSFISTKLTVTFAARLFTTPIKHKLPKREVDMDRKSQQETLFVSAIGKEIVVYHFGDAPRKILLVHGWSGRGTQLVKFAETLTACGYATISFDAPAHGKSPGTSSLLPEFVESIIELEKKFGPFEAAIGHSLGGMALLNAIRVGLKLERLVIIGSGDIISDITDDFVKKLKLIPQYSELLRQYFERKNNMTMDSFSSWHSAKVVNIPVLVIHDENDDEVPVKCAIHIHENLPNGELMITKNLGHRKILGNNKVVEKTLQFIQKEQL